MNWMIGIHELTDDQMEQVRKNKLLKTTLRTRIITNDWDVEKAVSKPAAEKSKRKLIRERTEKQVIKQMEILKKRGWVPVMDKPKLDPGNPYAAETESYVMVMEVARLANTSKS